MRLAVLTLGVHPDLIGGAYRYVTEISQGLARRGHGVDVICPKPIASLPTEEIVSGLRVRRFPNASGFFFNNWRQENRAARALLKEILDRDPTTIVLICHAYFAPLIPALPAAPVFLFTGPWAEEYLWNHAPAGIFKQLIAAVMRRTERRALRSSSGILTISRYYEEMLPRWHGTNLPRIGLLKGGVDAEHFAPATDRPHVREKLGAGANEFVLLALRRLEPRMGLALLLESFADASKEFPNARLWVAGQGSQQGALTSRTAALGLERRVKIMGKIPEANLPGTLSAADCLIMPSLDLEGFGLATLEALACGTPVLGSNCGANPELLGPIGKELLFEANSRSSLTGKLRQVLSGRLRLPPRAACRQHVLENFSWAETARQTEEYISEYAAQRGMPRLTPAP